MKRMCILKMKIAFYSILIFYCILNVYCFAQDLSINQVDHTISILQNNEKSITTQSISKDYSIITLLDEISNLKSKINTLSNEITSLKDNRIPLNKLDEFITRKELESINDEVDELSTIANENELKSCLDRLNIYAELRTRSDWFTFKGHVKDNPFDLNSNKEYTYERVHMLTSNRLRLNFESTSYENIKFYSRMGIYYYWLTQSILPNTSYYNFNLEREPSNTLLKVERAYVDIFVDTFDKLPFAISFGRLPTTDGLPTDLREDTPRKSTFPSIAYDILADGIGLSFNLSKIFMDDSYIRMMYCRYNILNEKTIYRKNKNNLENANVYTAQLETNIPGKWDKALFMIYFCWINKASPLDNYGQITIPSGTQLFPPPLPPIQKDAMFYLRPLEEIKNDSYGKFNKLTFYLQIRDFLHSGFDGFLSYNTCRTSPKGSPNSYGTYLANIDENLANMLGNISVPIVSTGLLSETNDKPHNGYAIQCGLRYTFPINFRLKPKIGMEYIKTSKNWTGFTLASEDPLHKLDIRGEAIDLYYIQPLNASITFRFGLTAINYDYDQGLGFYINTPKPVDWKVNNSYVLVDAKF